MNILQGQISNIQINGSLALVTIKVNDIDFTAIVIETQETANYLEVGHTIHVVFKETEVVIAAGAIKNISLQNRISGTITHLKKGTLLSKITIATRIGNIVSMITTNAVDQLQIKIGSDVTAMIKTNEILLQK